MREERGQGGDRTGTARSGVQREEPAEVMAHDDGRRRARGENYFWADELFVSTADSEAANGQLTGRHHIAFQAQDRAMVDAFHQAALAAGGKDNGAPGERKYHPGYYGAFVLDPDGNNIEAVYHGEANRSAASVKVTF
jgi:catechol 2,3-dioxygenase-like lactoylglutathione lyase family enzyme